MQNLQVSEHSPVLDERLTLVLLTHDRPAYLKRALQYYQHFAGRILVLDSSAIGQAALASQFPGTDYRHVPQFGYHALQAKLAYGAAQVGTPFMAFVADDDFTLQAGLASALAFLEANPDYGMCQGYSLSYRASAGTVFYHRRDRKVPEDCAQASAPARLSAYLQHYLPTLYAVTRTELTRDWLACIPGDIGPAWLEISRAVWLLAAAKARVLPIAYGVRELQDGASPHSSERLRVLTAPDQASVTVREQFAEAFAVRQSCLAALEGEQGRAVILEGLATMGECLAAGRSASSELIVESRWKDALQPPQRLFEPTQYVEMPFYNQALFDSLETIEFLLHTHPAGRSQLAQLEGLWADQEAFIEEHGNDTAETLITRLWKAMDCWAFNSRVVAQLVQRLHDIGETQAHERLQAWLTRLQAVAAVDSRQALAAMPSGQLMNWLAARSPAQADGERIAQHLAALPAGPQIAILLLDLDNDMDKLQVTLDSLVEGHYSAFKIIVFTTGEPPVATTVLNTLHFVKVAKALYVDKLNQIVRQTTCDWLVLAEVGDQFTPAGLARAALELRQAPECRAVFGDEIHRNADGSLTSVFRPGFNLDLLQSAPALMARHWLLRRDVVLEAGGYSANYSNALEFDLLLRIIETGGMGWLAHLDEPLLVCRAAVLAENVHERQALLRHLGTRGYQALVNSESPGTYRIEYRHSGRPLVSILLPCQDNLAQLHATLDSLRLRTRYTNYEVLVVDNASQDPAMEHWLEHAEQGRVRVLRSEQPVNLPALYNAASLQAKGEYLVLLDSDAQVVNPNWIESLLNHAQRPEVGVVAAKLTDAEGKVTQAGLLLGHEGGVGAAFSGEGRDSAGYMQRLAVDQNYSAVSAACLMIGSALFQGVGGLDDDLFGASLSDVDLCLKVGQAGYLIVWTPYVQVIHPGEVVQTVDALAALRGKWPTVFAHDLAYNRNLSQSGASFALGTEAPINWAPLLG
jgi:glycosyltransferase domain-containing protein